ncbi:hypothetical protein [Marinobacter bohaiensis]|uniref:hypothetical protein n=1 Tax=Marinobacter bohaiensis TaxID=2201898 RepID=UPI000DAB6F0A|nr:hypothetical protein [Marinobacter bohaiensis]
MNNTLNECEVAALRSALKHSTDPLSAEALLGEGEIEFRTLKRRWVGAPCRGTAEFIVHMLLDDDARKIVFVSPYELGNQDVIDENALSERRLIEYLETLRDGAGIVGIEDVLKDLKKKVLDLTGRKYRSYTSKDDGTPADRVARSYAIKALSTLYRYRNWEPKIFSRFAIPQKSNNFNLELRDAFPLDWTDDSAKTGVALYSDLKQSLTFGMSKEEINTILPAMGEVSDRFAGSSCASSLAISVLASKPDADLSFISEEDVREALKPEHPPSEDERSNRLDIDLYIGLTLREVELRLLGKDFLNRFLASEKAGVPALEGRSSDNVLMVLEAMQSGDSQNFAEMLSHLLGYNVSKMTLEQAIYHSARLARVVKMSSGLANLAQAENGSPALTNLERLAAVIACLSEAENPVRTKAYWYGKKNSSSNPLFYLDKIEDISSQKKIPEHYLEYWFRRFTLVLYRLAGQEALWHSQNTLEQLEGELVTHLFRTRDVTTAADVVTGYFSDFPDVRAMSRSAEVILPIRLTLSPP